jgi:hypothetical protein
MGFKLDWRGFLVAAVASVMATSFSELLAGLVRKVTKLSRHKLQGRPSV